MAKQSHTAACLSLIEEYQSLSQDSNIELTGNSLTIAKATAISGKHFRQVVTSPEVPDLLHKNVEFLNAVLAGGHAVYGVNTGYGASADVRTSQDMELQKSFIRLLNVGFADQLKPKVMRVVMAVRADSLARG